MGLLARREHSRKELRHKLLKRFSFPNVVEQVLDTLAQDNYQSDERFTEAFVASRVNKGQGPMRIAMELRERGIGPDLTATYLNHSDEQWRKLAADVRRRRFGADIPGDMKVRAKQMRFLQYRGFSPEQANAAFH